MCSAGPSRQLIDAPCAQPSATFQTRSKDLRPAGESPARGLVGFASVATWTMARATSLSKFQGQWPPKFGGSASARAATRVIEGQTFADIEAYGVKRWLDEIQDELRGGRYRPKPVRAQTRLSYCSESLDLPATATASSLTTRSASCELGSPGPKVATPRP